MIDGMIGTGLPKLPFVGLIAGNDSPSMKTVSVCDASPVTGWPFHFTVPLICASLSGSSALRFSSVGSLPLRRAQPTATSPITPQVYSHRTLLFIFPRSERSLQRDVDVVRDLVAEVDAERPGARRERFGREVEDVLVAPRVEAERVAGVRRRGRDGFDGRALDAVRNLYDRQVRADVLDAGARPLKPELHRHGAPLLEDRAAVRVDGVEEERAAGTRLVLHPDGEGRAGRVTARVSRRAGDRRRAGVEL